jgi:hypothetical protein
MYRLFRRISGLKGLKKRGYLHKRKTPYNIMYTCCEDGKPCEPAEKLVAVDAVQL